MNALPLQDQDWFEVRRFPHAVTMIREPHHREDVKSYLIEGSRDVAVLDTGTGAGDFAGLVASLSARRPRVLQTHADWDHIGASFRFDEVLVHPSEAEKLRAGYAADRFAAQFTPSSTGRGERSLSAISSTSGVCSCFFKEATRRPSATRCVWPRRSSTRSKR